MTPPDAASPESQSDQSTAGNATNGEAASQPSQDAGKSWFERIARPFRANDDPARVARATGAESQQADPDDEDKGAEPKPAEKAEDGEKPFKVFATKDEYDRAIQSEEDRRETVRKQREQAEERKRLRREDPEAYARLDEEREESEAETTEKVDFAASVINVYDGAVLDPILARLPADKRQEIVASIDSVEARTKAVGTAIDHLLATARAEGKAEGEKKARENPVVRKEVLREARGAEDDGPDLVEAGAPSRSGGSTNDQANAFLRRSAGVVAR